ncbi:MAG: crossover junction endodeoxyribonuclease RuvC [Candidatus Margulisbacteria bacterium]|nr:crossover junction endodeoxyribonuclease RuvC [Candidatus Margulisiibacteriota bacterium]
MLTLGVDPGTATTGYGLIAEKGEKLVFVDHGVILTSSKETAQSRLRNIYVEIKKLIKKHRPEAIAIEKLFFGANTKTAIAVGQARGMTLLAAAEAKVPVAEYTPLEVKMAVTGYGKADKKQVQQMVKTLLGLAIVPKPDDAADALAIAICHLHSYKVLAL